jgi:protein subunit release factor A
MDNIVWRVFWTRDSSVIDNAHGVVITHVPSGIQAACATERTLLQNQVKALEEV